MNLLGEDDIGSSKSFMATYIQLQLQYDKFYSYFRTTTEPFDLLEWDGHTLEVWYDNKLVESYRRKDLNFILKAK